MEEVEREIDGSLIKVPGNRYVEAYYRQQQMVVTPRKRKGFDSACFYHFQLALKAIAAFNGIFDLQENFSEAYSVKIDMSLRKRVKAEKKKVWKLQLLDQAIAEMRPRFQSIMKERLYEFSKAVSLQTRDNINFALFYLALVTMRYMGYRQMQLRDCVYGENIIFTKDGSITFHWEADKVKNDRILNHPLSKKSHSQAYGLLIEALNLYHKYLYKFALEHDGGRIDGQFFLKLKINGTFDSYSPTMRPTIATQFHGWFKRCAAKYLKQFDDLHPHFLRGLCGDWLGKELKVGIEKTSDAMGDTARTVERDYIDRDAPYDGEATFDAAEAAVKARRQKETGVDAEARLIALKKEFNERDRAKDELLSSALRQLEQAQAEIISLRAQLGINY